MYNRLLPAVPLATPVADSSLIALAKDALNHLEKKKSELDAAENEKGKRLYGETYDSLKAAIEKRKFFLQDLDAVKEYMAHIGDTRTIKEVVYQSRVKPKGWTQSKEDEDNKRREKAITAWRKVMQERQKHKHYDNLVKELKKEELTASKSGGILSSGSQLVTGMGLLLTVVSAGLLGYFAGQRIWGPNSSMALILTAVCGGGTLLLEGFLLVIRLSRADSVFLAKKVEIEALHKKNLEKSFKKEDTQFNEDVKVEKLLTVLKSTIPVDNMTVPPVQKIDWKIFDQPILVGGKEESEEIVAVESAQSRGVESAEEVTTKEEINEDTSIEHVADEIVEDDAKEQISAHAEEVIEKCGSNLSDEVTDHSSEVQKEGEVSLIPDKISSPEESRQKLRKRK